MPADPAQIATVSVQFPDEKDTFGLTDSWIDSQLSSGLSTTKVILAGWRAIAAKTLMVEDVSESGSSRTSRLNENAREMITIWQSRSDAEDKLLDESTSGRPRFASHKITRV